MDPEWWSRLSPKMRDVYELEQEGLTPKEIGARFLMSEFTVRTMLEVIEERRHPPSPDIET